MPRAKRNKVVSLTKTKKKGKEGKQDLLGKIQAAVTEYDNCFVLNFENMRSTAFK